MKADNIDSSIDGTVSCSQFDYSGRRLALSTSDSLIKLYTYTESTLSEQCVLQHHNGEVLSLSWSHPKFGSLLASSSSDRTVLIWREQSQRFWNIVYEHTDTAAVNCVSWGPWELGLQLLAGLEDGNILIFSYKEEWETHKISAHTSAVKAIAWGPAISLVGANGGSLDRTFRFATGAGDGKIKCWGFEDGTFTTETLEKHPGCIRDLSWNPSISSNRELIASCADRNVQIWYRSTEEPVWKFKDMILFPAPVWKISWNTQGNYLAVSAADNITRVLMENSEENWKVIKQVLQKGEIVDISEN